MYMEFEAAGLIAGTEEYYKKHKDAILAGRRTEGMGYKTCPHCGANLDPGERCNCQDKEEESPAPASVQG